MKKLTLNNKNIKQQVNALCREITKTSWRPNYIVGLTRGGLIPAVMLSHYFDVPMHSLNVSLRDSTIGPETNCWMSEDAFGYVDEHEREIIKSRWDPKKRQNILIVDDINDTGATFNWILDDWQSSCLPNETAWSSVWNNNVRFAVLYNNIASNFDKIDYFAEEINKAEDDVWIDFPWEHWWQE